VSQEIEDLFGNNDFALAYTLDAIASTAAECTADRLEERFDALVLGDVVSYYPTAHLRYSPGYCGWHISGQKKLFERLGPDAIGVTLNKSCLMQPLKSVSGVIVSGKTEIHFFDNSFSFCAECTTKTCRDRLKHIMTIQKGSN
jgi:cobalamin-dependent methionine synthase I